MPRWYETMNAEERKAVAAKAAATRSANIELKKQAEVQRELELRAQADEIWLRRNTALNELEELEARVKTLKYIERWNPVVSYLTDTTLYLPEDIVEAATSVGGLLNSGIYFLIKDEKIIYVGQSISVLSRVKDHQNYRDFDHFTCIPCPKEHLDMLESLYIHFLRPEQNAASKYGVAVAPMTLAQIMTAVKDAHVMD